MKNKFKLLFLNFILIFVLTGCSTNEVVKDSGEEVLNLYLEPNTKLESINWENYYLWYLTRPMEDDERAVIHSYNTRYSGKENIEYSSVKIIETKLNSIDLEEYNTLKSQGYTIEDYITYKESGTLLSTEELTDKSEDNIEEVVESTYESENSNKKVIDEFGYPIK